MSTSVTGVVVIESAVLPSLMDTLATVGLVELVVVGTLVVGGTLYWNVIVVDSLAVSWVGFMMSWLFGLTGSCCAWPDADESWVSSLASVWSSLPSL